MQDFLNMGEYSSFILTAYGITAVVMAGLFVASWRRLREREAALADLLETFEEPRPVGPVGIPANDRRSDREDQDNHDGPPS